MKACHFLMPTDWFEEMIGNWLQLVCTSFRIKWANIFACNCTYEKNVIMRSNREYDYFGNVLEYEYDYFPSY